jgi:hypothetical protein
MYKKCFILILLLPLAQLEALDFGLVINQFAALDSQLGNESKIMDNFEYRAGILPRVSFLLGDKTELFLSAGLTLGMEEKKAFYIPELLRNEIVFRLGNWGISAGRIHYADPLGIVALGLFDGFRVSYNSKVGAFGLGAWYTGFLFKKNANIIMTSKELSLYETSIDYGNFYNTYFAPRHLIASIDWEHPSVGEFLQLKAAITGQVDFSGSGDKYHSQYVTLKASMPIKSFSFGLGGSLALSEYQPTTEADAEQVDENKFSIAYALDMGIYWNLPTKINSRLSLTVHYTSGQTDGTISAFVPITNNTYGNIIGARLPGISIFALDYTVRLLNPLGLNLNASYFMRNDLGTYTAWPVNLEDNTGYFLGSEFFSRLVFSPISDLQFILGGGLFLPSLGNVSPKEKLKWRAELSAILALF